MAAADEADEDEEAATTCYVLPANVPAVRVFLASEIALQVTMGGVVYTGIPRSEILAVCDLLGIPTEQRADALLGVRIMLNTVLPQLNARHD